MPISDERMKQLEGKITDLEESLSKLKGELHKEREEEQHEAIDNLDEYIDEIDHRYANLHDFWAILGKELRELFSGGEEKQDKSNNDEKS